MNRIIFISIIVLLCKSNAMTQIGGETVFNFLNLPYNARSSSLGREHIACVDSDINLAIGNPSLLNFSMNNKGAFNQGFLPTGINFGMLNYGKSFKNGINMSYHLRYANYGKQIRTDYLGYQIGEINPMDFIIGSGIAKTLNPRLSIGANLNFIYSQLTNYNSFGASVDLAGTYLNSEKEFVLTAIFKNVGAQFSNYYGDEKSNLPAQFQISASKKLENSPFRFALLFHNLNRWDLTYFDPSIKPTIDPLTNEIIPVPKSNFMGKIAHHIVIQSEISISKSIFLRAGYDFQRAKEMKLTQRGALTGISFGLGLKFKRFNLDYGFLFNSTAGKTNLLSVTIDFEKIKK